MFDEPLRRFKERLFVILAVWGFDRISPLWLSVIGLVFGVVSAVALAYQLYVWGFVAWFFNRFFDGLDGTVARRRGAQSDFGGYFDIMIDFVVYAIIPIGLVLGQPTQANFVALAVLLAVFYVNAASWMYLSAILEKRAQGQDSAEFTTVNMPNGIIGGAATILFYTAFMFFPSYLAWLFGAMALLVAVTVVQRLVWAKKKL